MKEENEELRTIQSLLSSHVFSELIKTQTGPGWIGLHIKIKNGLRTNLLYFDLAYYDCALRTHNNVFATKKKKENKSKRKNLERRELLCRSEDCGSELIMNAHQTFPDMTTCKCFVSHEPKSNGEEKNGIHCC